KEPRPNDRIFVWGSWPELYSFSNRRMATRFVSCSHLVGGYSHRPREVRDTAKSVIPESWVMFQADWEAHPPVLIIDTSTVDRVWAPHPMTRYPVLRAFLGQYRIETVIDGDTIYRRLDTGSETARMTTKKQSISVVYPMFNEEENIERAVHFAEAVLTDMTSDYEILIVNDASTDRSAEIAEVLAR